MADEPWYEYLKPPWARKKPPIQEMQWYPSRRKAFIEENGYYITLPEFEDVIHFRVPPKISEEECKEWKKAKRENREPNIHREKANYLDLKRRRFESVLASPQPGWLQKIGSVMTWLDDCEDTLSTGVLLGRFALRLMPRIGARFVPILGWALLATDIIELGSMAWKMGTAGTGGKTGGKRRSFDIAETNPFSREARIRGAKKLAKKLPGAGEILEALQTMDNITGVGLCFGSIVGALEDAVAGAIRGLQGERVSIKLPTIPHSKTNIKMMRSMASAPDIWGGSPEWDDEVYQNSMLAYAIGMNHLAESGVDITTAYDEIEDWSGYRTAGRRPWRTDTIWMLEDEGFNIDQTIGWPTTNTNDISYRDRFDINNEGFKRKFTAWAQRNKYSQQAYAVNQFTTQATEMFINACSDPGDRIKIDTDEMALIHNTFHNNFYPDPNTPTETLKNWVKKCKAYKAATGVLPSTRTQKEYMTSLGINFSNKLPEKNLGIAAEIWPELA